MKIAYLGPPGSYSEEAVKNWDSVAELIPVDSIHAVAKCVSDGKVDHGMVPIENSIEGGVTSTLDLLIHDFDLSISGESILTIKHCLMGQTNLDMSKIDYVFLDGGHSYETVRNDLEYSKKVLQNNGTILCDDYNLHYAPGVTKAVDEFVLNNDLNLKFILNRFAKIEKK